MALLSNLLFALAGACVFFGLIFILVPFVSLPLFGIGWLLYMAAQRARREARAQSVRRQLGG